MATFIATSGHIATKAQLVNSLTFVTSSTPRTVRYYGNELGISSWNFEYYDADHLAYI